MKKLFFILACVCLSANLRSQNTHTLQDGLYLVKQVIYDPTTITPKDAGSAVYFNALFLDNAPEGAKALVLDTSTFVPLELASEPELIPQADNKKKIQLSFSRMASDRLASFTSKNLMKQATLVVDGEALTVHKIRAAITGGKMEITRCGDNACEKIYVALKDNIKH